MNFNRFPDVLNQYATSAGIDIEKLMKEKPNDENYYFLMLTIYFYLKNNNYNTTAELLFNEANLSKIFSFPQELSEGITESEQIKKKFTNFFYQNTYFQQTDNSSIQVDFLSDFWNRFWDIFVEKIRQSNQNNQTMDMYLERNKVNLTCIIYS